MSAQPRKLGFAPLWCAGVAGALGLAVAGFMPMRRLPDRTVVLPGAEEVVSLPLVGSLGIVSLAAWGTTLATTGWLRRMLAVVAVGSSLGALIELGINFAGLPERALAATGVAVGNATVSVYAAATGGVVSVCAGVWLALSTTRADSSTDRFEGAASDSAATGIGEDKPSLDPERDLWDRLSRGEDPTNDAP